MSGIDITPGVYSDVPFPEYRAWNAMNISTLKWGLKSPKHLKAAIEGRLKFPDSPDRKLGRAIHCRLLEPERYKSEFQVAGKCQAVFKSGKNKGEKCGAPGKVQIDGEWLCGKHGPESEGDLEILSIEEANRIERLNESVRQHPVIKLLRQQGGCEVSLCWEQEGLLMKGRLDKLIIREGFPPTIIDIKKVQVGRGDTHSVQAAIANYEYHVQAACYKCAVERLYGVSANFLWVFVEDDEPFDVNPVQAAGATLDLGLHQFKKLIAKCREMRETLMQPEGYSSDIQLVDLPAWYFRNYEQSYEGNDYVS